MGGDLGMSEVENICHGCGYNLGVKCQVLKNKQLTECFAKADSKEVIRREKAIEKYQLEYETKEVLTVSEKIERGFMELYKEGLSDKSIAVKLEVSAQSVGNYRRDLKLKAIKKRKKPAATGK